MNTDDVSLLGTFTACSLPWATLAPKLTTATASNAPASGQTHRHLFLRPSAATASGATLHQLNESLLAWLEVVYHRKLHSENGQAPLERFRQDPAPTTRPADPEELRLAFLHRAERKVYKTATVSFKGNRYTVPTFLRGKRVELRYDPFDLTRLEVWYNDAFP